MPRFERQQNGEREIVVIEARGHTVWERRARGRNKGRVRLESELDSAAAASKRVEDLRAQLREEGYTEVDPQAGVDRVDRGAVAKERFTVEHALSELVRLAPQVTGECSVGDVLSSFVEVFSRRSSFRKRGYWFEVDVDDETVLRASISIRAKVASKREAWREIGYDVEVEPNEDGWLCEVLQDEDCTVADFVSHVQQQPAWESVAEQSVLKIRVEDLEVD